MITWKMIFKICIFGILSLFLFFLFSMFFRVVFKIGSAEVFANIVTSGIKILFYFISVVVILKTLYKLFHFPIPDNANKDKIYTDTGECKEEIVREKQPIKKQIFSYKPTKKQTFFYILKIIYTISFLLLIRYSMIILAFGIMACQDKILSLCFLCIIIILLIPIILLLVGIIYTNKIIKGTVSKTKKFFVILPFVIIFILILVYTIRYLFFA